MPLPHARNWLPRVLIAAAAVACVVVVTLRATTAPMDVWLYDRMMTGLDQAVDDRIVMVVVDDKSFSALGRWPWSRGVHAELVQKLSAHEPRGIAFDLLFAEPSRSDEAGDAALAGAMLRAGNVASPVAVEDSQPDGPLIEVLPMPTLIEASAALGHVEIDVGADGIAREAYLYAGLGSAHWPALALALRNIDPDARRDGPLPGLRHPDGEPGTRSAFLWHRDYRVLVPYARNAGFQQVSYVDVLRGEVPGELLRDRWILVGVTASGSLREVLVPEANGRNRMPAVEFHAHLLNALLQGNAIVPLALAWQLAIGVALVLLPFAVYRPRHRIRRAWVASTAGVLATLLACVLLLHFARIWYAPTAALLVAFAVYGIWATQRLRKSHRLASSDGLTRLANRHMFDLTLERELQSARRSSRPLSLLLIDVDHFKPYNDHYGHQAGDEVLRKVADAILVWARRPRDLAARYGGDELALVLPESSAHAAATIAQTILEDVRALELPHAQSPIAPTVTLSIGIATFYPILEGHDIDLLKRADAALYRAKREGRNRVHASSGTPRAG
ncbi:diguanylate cyclase [Luteimonas aestuarii]|uniref:diguanylate cyclase n=1 Tax=Luteimonas aestuarii TaxID=453837 RepID=A0A4R5TY62_9GAMM|nr:diguanylate cyclase [Luteimonas aestuarii]TDK26130.1 diguanylate cyclase [Luteimonas aestuarii]